MDTISKCNLLLYGFNFNILDDLHAGRKRKWMSGPKVCTKANRALGFLRRNLFSCPKDVKEAAYKGLVPLVLEYGILYTRNSVWDPHTKGLLGEGPESCR